MKSSLVVLLALFLFTGCTQKPSCSDEEVTELVKDILVEELAKSIGKSRVHEFFEFEIKDFMTNKSNNENVEQCSAALITYNKKTKASNELHINYSARYTDDGDKVYVQVYD